MKKLFCLGIGGILLVNEINCEETLQKTFISEQAVTEIAIGSTNPVKIQAVKNALENNNIQVIPYAALSKVRPQPLSDDETLTGAINRAKDCLERTKAPIAIGLEAGVVFLNQQVYLCHWGAIVDRNQNTYFTNGPLILLPGEYSKPLLDGQNLEDIIHHSTGIENLGVKEGAIGLFTKNRLNREQVLTQIAKALLGQYDYYHQQNQKLHLK